VKHLFKDWKKIKKSIKQRKQVFLLLDYDGTLTPIKPKPELARLSISIKKLLIRLKNKKSFKLAIISGRSLKEVKRLVGIKGIIYAGNHGLELEGPNIRFINKKALLNKKSLFILCKKLKNRLSGIKGALIENKGLTLTVHFRLVREKDFTKKLKPAVECMLKPLVVAKKIRLSHGKKIYEIRPPIDWHKGRIVKWLLGHKKFFKSSTLPICIGDDHTDEDMFKAIGKKGITISVGSSRSRSRAKYYLKNTKDVETLLKRLDEIK